VPLFAILSREPDYSIKLKVLGRIRFDGGRSLPGLDQSTHIPAFVTCCTPSKFRDVLIRAVSLDAPNVLVGRSG